MMKRNIINQDKKLKKEKTACGWNGQINFNCSIGNLLLVIRATIKTHTTRGIVINQPLGLL